MPICAYLYLESDAPYAPPSHHFSHSPLPPTRGSHPVKYSPPGLFENKCVGGGEGQFVPTGTWWLRLNKAKSVMQDPQDKSSRPGC